MFNPVKAANAFADGSIMSKDYWKIIAASVAGTSHAAKNVGCQDFFEWQTSKSKDETLIAVVSDGAGSAKKGEIGAKIACQTLKREISSVIEKNKKVKDITRNHALEWLKLLQTQFQVLAEIEKLEIGDFACTLLCAIVQEKTAVFWQIGDGGMIYATADAPAEYQLVTPPQQGEYANMTNFMTDREAAAVLKFETIEKRIEKIAIFTDGLQRIALDYQTGTPHAPFFRPMFAPLGGQKISSNLNQKLRDFLDSPKINERTDDDKTLILASRKT